MFKNIEEIRNSKICFDDPYLEAQLSAIRDTTHFKNLSETFMLKALYENTIGTVDAAKMTDSYNGQGIKKYQPAKTQIPEPFLNNSKETAEAAKMINEYNAMIVKKYPRVKTRTMGRVLGEIAESSDLVEVVWKSNRKDRYGIRKDVVVGALNHKLNSSEKRKDGLYEIFEGDDELVSNFLEILLETNNDLLDKRKYNKNIPTYKKPVIPETIARVLSVDKSTAVEALELVSGLNGVSPFVIKGERAPHYYVNGKQNILINEFMEYLHYVNGLKFSQLCNNLIASISFNPQTQSE